MSGICAQWSAAGMSRVDHVQVCQGFAYLDTPRSGICPVGGAQLAAALSAPDPTHKLYVYDSEDESDESCHRLASDEPTYFSIQAMHWDHVADTVATLARFDDEESASYALALLTRLAEVQEAVANAQDAAVEALRFGDQVAPGYQMYSERLRVAENCIASWRRMLPPATLGSERLCTSVDLPLPLQAYDFKITALTRRDAAVVANMIAQLGEMSTKLEAIDAAFCNPRTQPMPMQVESLNLQELVTAPLHLDELRLDGQETMMPSAFAEIHAEYEPGSMAP